MESLGGHHVQTRQSKIIKERAGQEMAQRFALMEVKGDWKWIVETWSFPKFYWKAGSICWRCKAARLPRLVGRWLHIKLTDGAFATTPGPINV